MSKLQPCYHCPRRCDGCHGVNEDGTWRCAEYGAWKEKAAAKRAAVAAQHAAQRDVDAVTAAVVRSIRHAARRS